MDTCCSQPNGGAMDDKPPRLLSAARWTAAHFAAGTHALCGGRPANGFGILMYHRVIEPVRGLAAPTWNVPPDRLRRQLAGLLARGFQPWPLARCLAAQRESQSVPGNVFVVTFDDGYESVCQNAWPILRELEVPATVFLATSYVGSQCRLPFDDWRAAGSERVPVESWRAMSLAQCREMAADDLMQLGAHTHTHQDFTLRSDEFRDDLTRNLGFLETQLGVRNPPFAFPFGLANEAMMHTVKDAGLSCGLTTQARLVSPEETPFGWGRFDVSPWDTAATLAARLTGWYGWATHLMKRVAASIPATVAKRAAS